MSDIQYLALFTVLAPAISLWISWKTEDKQ